MLRLGDGDDDVGGVDGGVGAGDFGFVVGADDEGEDGVGREREFADGAADGGRVRRDDEFGEAEGAGAELGEAGEAGAEFLLDGVDDGGGGGDREGEAEGREDAFVARVVDAGDDFGDVEARLGGLGDGEVDLVAAGAGDDDVGAAHAGGALDVDFGTVAEQGDFAEFVDDRPGGVGVAFDDADFVAHVEEVAGGAAADFAAADDDDVHG